MNTNNMFHQHGIGCANQVEEGNVDEGEEAVVGLLSQETCYTSSSSDCNVEGEVAVTITPEEGIFAPSQVAEGLIVDYGVELEEKGTIPGQVIFAPFIHDYHVDVEKEEKATIAEEQVVFGAAQDVNISSADTAAREGPGGGLQVAIETTQSVDNNRAEEEGRSQYGHDFVEEEGDGNSQHVNGYYATPETREDEENLFNGWKTKGEVTADVTQDAGEEFEDEMVEDIGLNNQDEQGTGFASPVPKGNSSNGLQWLPSMMECEESLAGFETLAFPEVSNGHSERPTNNRHHHIGSGFNDVGNEFMEEEEDGNCTSPLAKNELQLLPSEIDTSTLAEVSRTGSEPPVKHHCLGNGVPIAFETDDTDVEVSKDDDVENVGLNDRDEQGTGCTSPSATEEFVHESQLLPLMMESGESSLSAFGTSFMAELLRGQHNGLLRGHDPIRGGLMGTFESVAAGIQKVSNIAEEDKNIFLVSDQYKQETSSTLPRATDEFAQLLHSSLIESGESFCAFETSVVDEVARGRVSFDSDGKDVDDVPKHAEDRAAGLIHQNERGTSSTLLHTKLEFSPDALQSLPSIIESGKRSSDFESLVTGEGSEGHPERPPKHQLGNAVRVSFDSRNYTNAKGAEKVLRDEKSGGEGQKEVAVSLWVKYRGKWESAIRCCMIDCPAATLKSKPNYSKKKHEVVYFPSTRTFSWVDAQHTCPVFEDPIPLLNGTHASGREAVKDVSMPHRRMLLKLGDEMLDISDRLHVKAVVESSQNVNVWKMFAKEAAAATRYEELGTLLVRLHLTINGTYIKPAWTERRYGSWKEDCTKAASAATVQKLTKELVNAVLWDEVIPLWNTSEPAELDPEWEHWKGEAFEEKDGEDNPDTKVGGATGPENSVSLGRPISAGSVSKRFKEQARARRQTRVSPVVLESSQPKRSKVDSLSSNLPVGLVGPSFGHATTAFRSPLVHPSPLLQGQKATQVLGSDGCYEVVPGLTLTSSIGDLSPFRRETLKYAEPSSNIPVTNQVQLNELDSPIGGDEKCLANTISSRSCVADLSQGPPACNSGLCSAFLKKKNRRCNRQAKEKTTYCGKHKHLANPEIAGSEGGAAWESSMCSATIKPELTRCEKLIVEGSAFCEIHAHIDTDKVADKNGEVVFSAMKEQLDFSVPAAASPSNESKCNGITTRGVRCTHKPKDGTSFCIKHSTQGVIVQVKEESRTQTTSMGSQGATKRESLPQIGWRNETEKRSGSAPGQAATHHFSPGPAGNGLGQTSATTSTESKFVGNDGMSRKRKWVSSFFGNDSVQPLKAPLSSRQETLLPKVSESRVENSDRCISRTTRTDEQCSFRAKVGHAHCTKHLQTIEGRKPQEEDMNTNSVSGAKDILERYVRAAEGISSEAHGLESQKLLLKRTRDEAAKDYSTADELLKLVKLEMLRVREILLPTGVEVKNAEVNAAVPLLCVPETGKVREGQSVVRCGLCDADFQGKAELGRHWKCSHRKELSLLVKGYACRQCNRLYSRKHTVRRHWKKRHKSLPVISPDWIAVCRTCELKYADHNVLLEHVISGHPDLLSSTKLKNMALQNGVENPGELETTEILECADCHEEFSTHWDLFHHKERKHKNLETEVNGARTIKTGKKCLDLVASSSQSVPQTFGCRICGKKFSLNSDLVRHKEVTHASIIAAGISQGGPAVKRVPDSESNRVKIPFRRKAGEQVAGPVQDLGGPRRNKKRCRLRLDNKSNENNPKVMVCRMKAAVQSAQLRTLRQQKRADPSVTRVARGALYALTKGGQMLPFDGEPEWKSFPDDTELLDTARSVCCHSKLLMTLGQKYTKLPEQLFVSVSKLCHEAKLEPEWQAECCLCRNGCKEPSVSKDAGMQHPVSDPLASWKSEGSRSSGENVDELVKYCPNPEHVDSESSAVILSSDLSNGQEPVAVVCFVDEDVVNNWTRMHKDGSSSSETFKPWDNFNYITKRVLDPSLNLDPENYKVGCSCENGQCSPQGCDHVDIFDNDNVEAIDIFGNPMKGRFPYDEKGCIILEEGYLVYECNSSCRCDQTCQNRVLQKGVTVKLEVFRTLQKGWAVRAAQMIPRGTFVCEYVGEVLHDQEANKRGERYDQVGCSYLYDIDAHLDTTGKLGRSKPFVIDATKHGNVARFINHSCAPNLVNYQVLVDSMDCQLAHIGLFASRDIAIGEELAYDYRYKLLPGKGCPCHCGAQNCRGRLY